jgi:hypothetical protein
MAPPHKKSSFLLSSLPRPAFASSSTSTTNSYTTSVAAAAAAAAATEDDDESFVFLSSNPPPRQQQKSICHRKYFVFVLYLSCCYLVVKRHHLLFLSMKKYTATILVVQQQQQQQQQQNGGQGRQNNKGITAESTVATTVELASNATRLNDDNSNETYLFIHVGPVKTGSSSIQCNLQVNPFLKNSSYIYLGKRERLCAESNLGTPPGKLFNVQRFVFQYILRGWLVQDAHQPYVQSFKEGMEKHHDKGMHTIMSGEEFCAVMMLNDELFQMFVDLLDSLDQHVRFQVVYRYFFE